MTHHLRRCLPALIVTVTAAGCAPAPNNRPLRTTPVETGAGTVAAARDILQGVWVLESFEVFPEGRPPIALSGKGRMVYDGYANMTMDLQPEPGTVTALEGAGVPVRNGRISISGRTVVDMQGRTLTFVTEAATTGPADGPLALSRPRHWAMEDGLLTLATHDDGGRVVAATRWRKQ